VTLLVQPCAGPNGSAVTNANASGGNQFVNVGQSGTGTVHNWDNGQTIHGNATSLLRTFPTVAATAYEEWTNAVVPATNNAYGRCYIYLTAFPSVNTRLAAFGGTTGTLCSACSAITSGVLRMGDTGGAAITSTVATIPLNQWVRIEFELTGISGTSGTATCRFYSGANLEGTTPDTNGTATPTASSNITGQVGNLRWGAFGSVTQTTAFSERASDLAYSDVSQPGPLVAASLLPQQIKRRWPAVATRITARADRATYGR